MPEGNRPADLRETARLLNSAAIHLLRNLRAVDKESGLSPARLSALSVLVFGGPIPLGRLARIEGVTSPTMTRIVDGLEGLGLAERRPHPDSARLVVVAATDRGRQLMEAAAERRSSAIAAALGALPDDDRTVVCTAAPALRDLAAHLATRHPSTG
jgi:DNA-binding MarR family transcriptional regulator